MRVCRRHHGLRPVGGRENEREDEDSKDDVHLFTQD